MKNNRFQLLVVDDDELVHDSIKLALPPQWEVTGVKNINHLNNIQFDAAFVDMHLSGQINRCEGLEVIASLIQMDCHLEVVAMSGHLDRATMEACLKAGASRFLAKPLTLDELKLTLEKIEALLLLKQAQLRATGNAPRWIGGSRESTETQKKIAAFRGEKGPILIEGPSGTGKEVAAQLIHFQEGDNRPFVSINVAAIADNLFESEMFGHIKGAFTGAENNKIGLIEAAHGGDLFLDEIEALPPGQQAKLLRFLEDGEIRRVGDKKNIKVNTRVIAATNQNLETMVSDGKFREDLMWRLNGKKLKLSPLRERREDIPALADFFLNLQRPKHNKSFDKDTYETLQEYPWPGNVRELKRVCEQLVILSPLPFIRKTDVQQIIGHQKAVVSSGEALNFDKGLSVLMAEYEASIIKKSLEIHQDIDAAAKLLKISRSNLYKKIKDYQIEL